MAVARLGLHGGHAARVLDGVIEQFGRAGYARVERRSGLEAALAGPGRPPIVLALVPEGRVFGGTWGLEVAAAQRLLPETRGLRARGRGAVRMTGIRFSARRGDTAGLALADALERDDALARRLADVHFERIRIEPDGRPVIRHMGGSLVWFLFPPLRKAIPLVPEQVRALVRAIEAFAAAGATAVRPAPDSRRDRSA